ncbi:Mucin-associated surface protein (MASP) [Trypanosoma cruzi]|uniref:Mucin-associated surface protein (MASP), putative n=2 Tax=Trypanosoma cruzi TaxID=5693 RepID=Q4E4W7_TRYCC|nr:mucin-associated surface protein (MASP), putative [Trypanosoma cruzi]EAN99841.1 mucin-associated surface protein (MASP), putative [Trypanosoma cruzi]PWV21316.1 Mucin-associated surface protein (MASP) [Trypanosoma cruzi]RNC42098.1 mucin-associated surface protein (MASP) [Trypanosoma cruzi]|eukprot:XP_821692.1 mucin-associated surface protein (MASP) [Trypanosoma cruzi strain CL Brener]
MAMMMTGRVLLVCALCVLWCGAVFGYAMEDYCSEGGGNGLRHTSNGGDDGVSLKSDCRLLSARMALIKAVEAEEAGSGLSVTLPPGKPKETSLDNNQGGGAPGLGGDLGVEGQPEAAALQPTPGGSGTEEQVTELEVVDPHDKNVAGDKKEQKDVNAGDSQHQRADQSSSSSSSSGSSGTENVKQPALKENSKSNEIPDKPPQEEEEEEEKDLRSKSDGREEEAEEKETEEDKKKASNQAPTETPGGPTNKEEIQTATTETNGQPSPEALGDVKQSEEVQDEKDSNNNSQTKSVDSIAANQPNEPSADHGESGPLSPTANGDAANNDSERSTQTTGDYGPAADVAGTAEGKQNENKDVNPKETPVTATAMKTTTVTTGDSDGSTAASHTTSPLLLLLFVACAAAAAVVAA